MSATDPTHLEPPQVSLPQLVALVRMHHDDQRLTLEVADALLGEVVDKYLFAHPRLKEVQSAYLGLAGALSRHIRREESLLFSYLMNLDEAERAPGRIRGGCHHRARPHADRPDPAGRRSLRRVPARAPRRSSAPRKRHPERPAGA